MFWMGLLLVFVGGAGLLKYGIFGLLSASGAIAGLCAPGRIDATVRANNIAFLREMGVKVLTAVIAIGAGAALLAFSR